MENSQKRIIDLYLNSLKIILTDYARISENDGTIYHVGTPETVDERRLLRSEGRDWPLHAETMVGLRRLENIRFCIEQSLEDNVPGDFIETGVWRGGASIFAKAVLMAHGSDKTVWVCDSFQGLPKPKGDLYEADKNDDHHTRKFLAVSKESVKERFELYGLMDSKVQFVPGWFDQTLHKVPAEKFSVIRLDGDMYESTIVALNALYTKLSVGGYLIVDDYGAVPGCRKAVDDFRKEHNIFEPLVAIDWTGSYWQKQN